MKSWHDTDSQKFHSLIQAESHPEKHVPMRSNFDNQVWELFLNQNPCHILWPSPLGLPHCDGQRPAIILPVFPEKSFKSQLEIHFGISGWMCLRLYAYQTDVKKKTDLGICWWMMQHMKHQKTVFNCLLSEGTAKTNLSMTHKYYLMIGCITRERNSTKLTHLSIRNDQSQSTLIVIHSMFLICR